VWKVDTHARWQEAMNSICGHSLPDSRLIRHYLNEVMMQLAGIERLHAAFAYRRLPVS
jgi:hypothetical protein